MKFDIFLAILAGVMLFALITGAIFELELTFGQRCAAEYPKQSVEWERCIDRLSEGGEL